ncbi:hypothetical protein BGE01nite_24060 [Brevifollis gellanilyticus]|uniref:Uncharacterized protein n=1 Tax=Brevifollis gellanilyticus TaxID=748831 RepID=A0A512M8R5_9BACT|nr:hypothetical protein BGE01nite_24060 [Brevifollis gellanilyticus]
MKLILALLLPVPAFTDSASSLAGKTATLKDETGKATTTSSTSGPKRPPEMLWIEGTGRIHN